MKKNIKLILVIGILLVAALIGGYFLFKDNGVKDNVSFAEEYKNVDVNNVFVYRDIKDIIKIMENGTGVVYLGFPECQWCQAYVKYLNEVAKEEGIDTIYYHNILEDRKNNTEDYQKILSLLEGYLQYDNEGNPRVYVPNVSFHIKGKVVGNDYETSLDTHELKTPSEYWTEEEVKDLKDNLSKYMKQVYIALNACTECDA